MLGKKLGNRLEIVMNAIYEEDEGAGLWFRVDRGLIISFEDI